MIVDELCEGVVESFRNDRGEAQSEGVEDHFRETECVDDWCAEESSDWVGFVGVMILDRTQLYDVRPVCT